MKLELRDYKHRNKKVRPRSERLTWVTKLRRSRFMAFLPFVLLALLVWIIQTLQYDVIRTLYFPIGTAHISKSTGTHAKIPEVLEVQVQDKGVEHLRYSLREPDTIQLSTFKGSDGTEYMGIQRKELSDLLAQQLSASATVVQRSFSELKIPIYQRDYKRVPVIVGGSIRTVNGYTVARQIFTPDSVTIYGEGRSLRRIKEIATEPIRDTITSTAYDQKLSLQLSDGIHSDVTSVRVQILLEELTEQKLSLPIVILNPPQGYRIIPLPSTADVQLTLPRSKFSELTEDMLRLSADYNTADEERSELHLQLSHKPSWIVGWNISPTIIQFVKEVDSK